MNTNMLLQELCRRVLRYKLRSCMMMLGVMVGSFILVGALALKAGFQQNVLDYLSKTFLPNSITLAGSQDVAGGRELTLADIEAVVREVDGIVAWSPLIPAGRRNLSRGGRENFAALSGASDQAQMVTGQYAVEGTHFTAADVRTRARVVLLGRTVVEKLFPDQSPLGEPLVIDNLVFTVQGVLSELGGDPHGGDLDNTIVIPWTTLLQMNKSDNLFNVRFLAAEGSDVEQVAQEIGEVVRARHNIGPGRSDDFFVSTSPRGKAAFEDFEATFNVMLPVVTGVIFLISACVIAIITLTSVRERVPEIGLRKAVGARRRDIGRQFLLETALLSVLGGASGILLTLPGLRYLEIVFERAGGEMAAMPSPWVILLCLGCSIVVGLAAGFLPARRAAKLLPVEALR